MGNGSSERWLSGIFIDISPDKMDVDYRLIRNEMKKSPIPRIRYLSFPFEEVEQIFCERRAFMIPTVIRRTYIRLFLRPYVQDKSAFHYKIQLSGWHKLNHGIQSRSQRQSSPYSVDGLDGR